MSFRISFILTLLFTLGLSTSNSQGVESGVLDLSGRDLTEPIELRGQWEFYPQQLIDPVRPPAGGIKTWINFPSLWTDGGMDAFGYASYKVVVVTPGPEARLSLNVEDMYCSYALYCNGELLVKNGRVGTARGEYQAEWRPSKVDLPKGRDTLQLVLHISNFEHSKGGALEPILIGDQEVISRLYKNQQAYDLLLTGCLIMGGLFFLGLYFFGRHEVAILYFSMFCITYAYRIIGAGHYVLHNLVENYPWWLSVRLEYITLFASVFFFAKFLICLYPEETSRKFVKIVLWVCSLSVLSTLVLPLYYFSQIIAPFFIFLMASFLYTVYVYTSAWKNRRPGSFYALISTGVAILIFSYNILSYFGLLSASDRVSFWGYVAFFFSQSLLLSHHFAYSFKTALEKARLANEAKTDFLATISHEIRTPLNAIVGMAHLTLRNKPRPDQLRNLEALTFSAENLTSLINDILDFNKIDSGSLSLERLPVNLREHAAKIVKGYEGQSHAKEIPINLNVHKDLYSHFLADPVRIAQVFNNLIGNAMKFTSKGQIDVEIDMLYDFVDSQIVEVRVKDTGPGIHKDKMELIFERFTQASTSTTREFGGTGLGLSIVRGILNLYGSQINVTSTLGQGSVFSFEIKLEKAKRQDITSKTNEKMESQGENGVGRLAGKRVLIVEDNLMNMVIAEEFLSRWGMILEKATNGEEAVDKTHESDFDLILMDLHMPVMDGYEASREIKRLKPSIPILALTASTVAEQEAQISEAGMSGFVLKPFHPNDLSAKLLQVLAE